MTARSAVFFGVGALAGAMLLRGFPDRDIPLLGIGLHRYFAFHSAAMPLLLFAAATHVRRFRWLAAAALGLAAGSGVTIGYHLLVDVFQPKTVVFPFVGTLVKGTMLDDTLWLLGNSVGAAALSARALLRLRRAPRGR